MNDRMDKIRNWTIINFLIFILTLVVNYLGAAGFFNGKGQAEISAKYSTKITPAGFAFSIWGVIYTLLIITLIYFFINRRNGGVGGLVLRISPLFWLSSIFNIAWIISFSYEMIGVSTILLLGMLFSLMIIVERIYNNREKFNSTLAGISFSLYAGWVFIASILNISVFLVKIDWNGFGISESIWTIGVLFLAIGFILFYLSRYKNAIIPISLAWAFFGIYSAYSRGEIVSEMGTVIQGVLIFGIIVFLLSSVIIFVRNKYSIFPKSNY